MRVVVQRVKKAKVLVKDEIVAQIGEGLLILIGATQDDGDKDVKYLADKCLNLRIFEDQEGKMNLSALETGAEILATACPQCERVLRQATRDGGIPLRVADVVELVADSLSCSVDELAGGEEYPASP